MFLPLSMILVFGIPLGPDRAANELVQPFVGTLQKAKVFLPAPNSQTKGRENDRHKRNARCHNHKNGFNDAYFQTTGHLSVPLFKPYQGLRSRASCLPDFLDLLG